MLKPFGLTSISLFVRWENTLTLLSHSLNFWGLNDKVVNGVPENLFSVDDTATDSSVALPFPVFCMQMRRSMAKLELYRKFTNSLAVFVLLSIAWIGYEVGPCFG